MKHNFARIEQVDVVDDYTLQLIFHDNKEKTINFEPLLRGELLGPLRDKKLFAQVTIDSETGTLTWPNGADFDPSLLYDWEKYEDEFKALMENIEFEEKKHPMTQ